MENRIQMNFSVEVFGQPIHLIKPYVTFIGHLEREDDKDIGFLFQYIRSNYEILGEDSLRLHLSLNDFTIEPFQEAWIKQGLISENDSLEKIEDVFFEQLKAAKDPLMNIRLMDGLTGEQYQGHFSLSGFLFLHLEKTENVTLYSKS